MVKIERLLPPAVDQWDAFVRSAPHASVYHLSAWSDLIREQFGHDSCRLIAFGETGTVVGVLPLVRLRSALFGNFAVSMPYVNFGGPVATGADAKTALVDAAVTAARAWGCAHLELRADEDSGLDWPVRKDKVEMTLSLPKSDEALWASFDPKLRAQIRRPQKAGATIVAGGHELLDDFYVVFSRNMRDLGTPVYPRSFFSRVLRLLGEQVRILVVKLDGKPVGAGFLIRWRDTVEIPWASSLREHNRVGVNMLLYWEALRFAIRQGAVSFDFGRSSRDSGTFRFKQQWGAQARQLYWYYWLRHGGQLPNLSPSNRRFRAAIRCWQLLPLWVANRLGPMIVGSLP